MIFQLANLASSIMATMFSRVAEPISVLKVNFQICLKMKQTDIINGNAVVFRNGNRFIVEKSAKLLQETHNDSKSKYSRDISPKRL